MSNHTFKYNNMLTKEFLIEEYIISKKSLLQIAKDMKITYSTIRSYVIKNNINIRNRKGKNNPNYKNGKCLKKYYCIKCDKKISFSSGIYGSNMCNRCINIGKKQSQKTKNKKSLKLKQFWSSAAGKKTIEKFKKRIHSFDCKCITCKAHNGETKGENNSFYGKHHTEETRKKIGLFKIGKPGLKGSNNPNWQGGIAFNPYPLGWTKTFKEQIRFRDGYKCQLCGCHEVECKTKLHVHHIDYNKQNLDINNLLSLCNSCHAKTIFDRNYWINLFKNKSENNVKSRF